MKIKRKNKRRKVPKFSVIYPDPPWNYRDQCRAGKRGATYKYSTMRIEEIRRLPIEALAADDCVLFLWATMPMLPEAISVVNAWGFSYKTVAFTWVKTNTKTDSLAWGMGNWTRANAEVCLLGVRGKPKRVSAAVHSVIIRPRMKHSRKPPEIRDRIVELCGDVPRVELFATEKTDGWFAWGAEINEPDIALVRSPEDGKAEAWRFTNERSLATSPNHERSRLATRPSMAFEISESSR